MTSPKSKRHTLRAALAATLLGAGCASANVDNCADTPGVICTWAGTGDLAFDGDGHALTKSKFYWPVDLTIDRKLGTYILDWNNHRVRKLQSDGTLQTVIGADFVGDGPPDLSDLKPPGAPGTEVLLNHPTQLVPMLDGTMTLVSWHNHKLRSYDPETGLVTVTCGGSAAGFAGDGGPAAKAKLNQPTQLVVADDSTQYFIDQRNQVVRTIDPAGIINTLAGTPTKDGFAGDDGPADKCMFSFPKGPNPPPGGGIALDGEGHLFVSDSLNNRIRRIDLDTNVITTIAGTGKGAFSGDGGKAVDAELWFPRKLTFGPDKRLYVGDMKNNRIRAIDLKKGTITTVAGNGHAGFDGDGVAPTDAALNNPTGVTFDHDGAMYIIDTLNSRIRRVAPEDAGSAP